MLDDLKELLNKHPFEPLSHRHEQWRPVRSARPAQYCARRGAAWHLPTGNRSLGGPADEPNHFSGIGRQSGVNVRALGIRHDCFDDQMQPVRTERVSS